MEQTRGKVLVVDDEPSVLDVLRRYLTKAGYEITVAPNGAAALEMVHSGQVPDLIVLDLMMPVMSGFEVLSALQANKAWSEIPVILLSATAGYMAGHLDVDAILPKPFDIAGLDAAIQAALASRRKKKETPKKETAKKEGTAKKKKAKQR
jgi:CheY-like chemotaxis protein